MASMAKALEHHENISALLTPIKSGVLENDKIITLSTCRDSKGNRVVMHAKLIKLQKK